MLMNYFITLYEQPNNWFGDDEELKDVFTNRKSGDHPCLRYEDVMAHLFMQIVGYTKNAKDTHAVAKTARQYANQAMKKICWNCRFSKLINYPKDYTAAGLSEHSSKRFAKDIRMNKPDKPTCHKNCGMCRVGKIIIFGNSFESMIYWKGESLISKAEEEASKYFERGLKWKKKYLRERFVLRKVLEAKRGLEEQIREMKKQDGQSSTRTSTLSISAGGQPGAGPTHDDVVLRHDFSEPVLGDLEDLELPEEDLSDLAAALVKKEDVVIGSIPEEERIAEDDKGEEYAKQLEEEKAESNKLQAMEQESASYMDDD